MFYSIQVSVLELAKESIHNPHTSNGNGWNCVVCPSFDQLNKILNYASYIIQTTQEHRCVSHEMSIATVRNDSKANIK